MKTYFQLITEAPKAPKPAAIEAERLRKESIAAYKEALKTPNLAKETIETLKQRIKMKSKIDYTSPVFADSNFKVIIKSLKETGKDIKYTLSQNQYYIKFDREEKKILDNPYTICDILSDPKPNRFIDLIKNGAPDASAKWIDELQKIKEAFDVWFEAQGGRKKEVTNIFAKLVACKNRAPWAAWSGKGYRGVTRTTAVVSKYNFTGEVKKIGKNEWLIAKGTYKSRYDAQSWSDEWRTAEQFSDTNLSDIANPIGVVFEVDLKKNETLLSSDVIRKISGYGGGTGREREVIRVGNAEIPVTVYVDSRSIGVIIGWTSASGGKDPRKYVYDRAVGIVGVKGADAFAKTNAFKRTVKEFE
jgi:hypothetical protein